MKEYKGLKVPETLADARVRQCAACDSANCYTKGKKLDCAKCIFNADNLGTFIEWEKDSKGRG